MPKDGAYVNVQNIKRLTKALLIIDANFEYVLIPSPDNINFGPNTKKHQNHIVCSYGYKLLSVDERYSKPYKTYFGKDAIDKFLMIQ